MKTLHRTPVAIAMDILMGRRPNLGAVLNAPQVPDKPQLVGRLTPMSRSKAYNLEGKR